MRILIRMELSAKERLTLERALHVPLLKPQETAAALEEVLRHSIELLAGEERVIPLQQTKPQPKKRKAKVRG